MLEMESRSRKALLRLGAGWLLAVHGYMCTLLHVIVLSRSVSVSILCV